MYISWWQKEESDGVNYDANDYIHFAYTCIHFFTRYMLYDQSWSIEHISFFLIKGDYFDVKISVIKDADAIIMNNDIGESIN